MAFNIDEFRTNLSLNGEHALTDKFDVTIPKPALLVGEQFDFSKLTLQCDISELPGKNINVIEYKHYGFTKRIPHHITFPEITMSFYCNGNMFEKKWFDVWMDTMIPSETGIVEYFSGDGNDNYATDIFIKQYSHIAAAETVKSSDGLEEIGVTANRRRSIGEKLINSAKNKAARFVTGKFEKLVAPAGLFVGNLASNDYKSIVPRYNGEESKKKEQFKPLLIYGCVLKKAIPVAISSMPLSWADSSIHKVSVTFAYERWLSIDDGVGTSLYEEALAANADLPPTDKDRRKNFKDRIIRGAENKVKKSLRRKVDKLI